MNDTIESTLGSQDWVKQHETELKNLLPDTWTHMQNLNALQIGFKLKLLGVDWRSENDFGKIMVFLEKIGIMLRDGMLVRRNMHEAFK